MYNLYQQIKIQIKQINFSYQILNKTFSRPQLVAWPNSLEEAIRIIREKYRGKKIEIIEKQSDYLSIFDRRKIKKELKDLL